MKPGVRARYWMKYKARKKYYDLGMYRKKGREQDRVEFRWIQQTRTEEE